LLIVPVLPVLAFARNVATDQSGQLAPEGKIPFKNGHFAALNL
jgi:hypothetical protein